MTHGDGEFMRASDAFSWYQEADPALRSTIVSIIWLDSSPNWEQLRTRLDNASRHIIRFRERVEELPARLSTPRFVIDEQFDISWHVRRIQAPAPSTTAAVLEIARAEAMTGFDRVRPLWKCILVEGVDDGRAALVMKVHHSLTDGQGAMKLAPLLFDLSQTPEPLQDTTPPPESNRGPLLEASIAHNSRQVARFAGTTTSAMFGAVPRLIRHPVRAVRGAIGTVVSIAETVAPVSQALSPVMRGRGLGRNLELVTVDLADLKRAAKIADATLNDAFLAAVTGGLRRYHEQHGAAADELRVTMPISIRKEDDPATSNRITLMRFRLPVSDADPISRMRKIDKQARRARAARSLPFANSIAFGLDLLPTAVAGSMLKRVDFLASDVFGPQIPLFLAGARVTAYTAFGPTMGCAANLTLMSYDGACHVGITTDGTAVPDPDVFLECLRAGFAEVLALAPPYNLVRVPVADGEYPSSRVPRSAIENER
ncbi:wax ester/triacylglycerol synthase family O-acyltransferase [Antrihabitans sp. YC2-6]|uniref:wax ester/triacylglycerol synthase family O-acyltransferase n=1 Tax=Antrihabitans sp. YC2-6 TaxID=2799498 RepID=UPI0018F64324|nr:wax ester/triacylglycerol synthase family O-acyltransferase [Antrihabitans sp. YC2-6]MBJ8347056.1 wax ester/triacylglycerol synthase family O-acyltransferase [Antrihabitans sp. YC2-6]